MKLDVRRLIAFAIDWNLTYIIGMALLFGGPQFKTEYLIAPSMRMFTPFSVLSALAWFVGACMLRDLIFGGRSLGKLICGLKIQNRADGGNPRMRQLILRNITFYFAVIEMVVWAVNNGVRLGDMAAGTEVVRKNGKK